MSRSILCFSAAHVLKAMLICIALSLLPASNLPADTRGKLTGVITDKNKNPIPGANVVLIGTSMGTAADPEGYYVVMNVPPESYDVRISAVGFASIVVKGLRISSGQTTTLDEKLSEEIVQAKEVVVIADRPLVDTRQTSAVSILNNEQISVLPVQNLQDIVNLQAGVVDGHFRGGRLGEVQYQVDGVSVNNPLTNESAVQLDRSVLQEVQVISGTFDAEYGQAMSGVVNAVLRSGRNDAFEWSAESYLGTYLSFGKNDRFPHLENVSPLANQSYQVSLSGPAGIPKTTFLLSARRFTSEGYLYGERRFNPTDTSDFNNKILHATGDGKNIPLKTNDEWSGQAKFSNTSLENIQISYQAIFNLTNNKPYKFDFRFNPDGTTMQRFLSIVHGLDITQMLTDKIFYTLNLRQNKVDYRDYKYEDLYDPRYLLAGQPQSDVNYEYGAIMQGVDIGRYIEKTTVYIAKASLTAQATNIHLLKAGIELQLSNITYGSPGVIRPTVVNGRTVLLPYINNNDPTYPGTKTYKPISFAAFTQDRVEWKDVMVRGGVRVEYFDANTTVPSDLQNPADTIAGAPRSILKKTKKKIVVAPRLGVSYPVIANGSVYFSYGHFYQMPAINKFFSNSNYKVLATLAGGNENYDPYGNPDLKPEFTTQYEFGLKAALTEFLGMDASLFYKDIRNLLGVQFIETYNTAKYARLTNIDFGSVGGFTLALDYRSIGAISATFDYTYQTALGNSSKPAETATRAAAGKDANPRENPFEWDQRHTINGTLTVQQPKDYSVTAIVKYGTGQPYTPAIGSGFGADLENNSARKSNAAVVDVRGEKQFEFGGIAMSAFCRVYNLFDASFFNGFVFSTTGSPDYSLTTASDYAKLNDPERFYAPRRIEIGISVKGISLTP